MTSIARSMILMLIALWSSAAFGQDTLEPVARYYADSTQIVAIGVSPATPDPNIACPIAAAYAAGAFHEALQRIQEHKLAMVGPLTGISHSCAYLPGTDVYLYTLRATATKVPPTPADPPVSSSRKKLVAMR